MEILQNFLKDWFVENFKSAAKMQKFQDAAKNTALLDYLQILILQGFHGMLKVQ
ncbi:hypothetical protein [Candidatus Tisiphia endosymbiont of Myopa tessellatipennis]|uniref:hypothetical protein n=1 Tax=Candidatus Tisiphia endosymbiont of Myopa tessellatipennis TaxID=3066257 RepID=UPI00313DBEBE